jgi:hypothetical protein
MGSGAEGERDLEEHIQACYLDIKAFSLEVGHCIKVNSPSFLLIDADYSDDDDDDPIFDSMQLCPVETGANTPL